LTGSLGAVADTVYPQLINKKIFTQKPFSSPQEVYLEQFSTCVPRHTKKGQENIPLQLWYFLTVEEN